MILVSFAIGFDMQYMARENKIDFLRLLYAWHCLSYRD